MNRQVPYLRAFLHILVFPAILIPCWILWESAPWFVVVPIVIGLTASVYWGIWLVMRDMVL